MTIADMNFVVTERRAEHIFPNGWLVIVHAHPPSGTFRLTVNKSYEGKRNEMSGDAFYPAMDEQAANAILAEVEARS